MLIHATSVAIDDQAVVLRGAAGMGKSDLALRLLDEGAQLIADDQTLLTRVGAALIASAPASIAGLIEVRHVGLLRMPCREAAPVALCVELLSPEEKPDRLPEPACMMFENVRVRCLRLPAFAASTPAKIHAVLKYPAA